MDVKEKLPLIMWRNSLDKQVKAKEAEYAGYPDTIARLEKITYQRAELISKTLEENKQLKIDAEKRNEEDIERRQLKDSLSILERYEGEINNDTHLRLAAFCDDLHERPLEWEDYMSRISDFENRLRKKEQELARRDEEKGFLLTEIEEMKTEIGIVQKDIEGMLDFSKEIADLEEQIERTEEFVSRKNESERMYIKLQAELQTLYKIQSERQESQRQKSRETLDPLLVRDYKILLKRLHEIQQDEECFNDKIADISEFMLTSAPRTVLK